MDMANLYFKQTMDVRHNEPCLIPLTREVRVLIQFPAHKCQRLQCDAPSQLASRLWNKWGQIQSTYCIQLDSNIVYMILCLIKYSKPSHVWLSSYHVTWAYVTNYNQCLNTYKQINSYHYDSDKIFFLKQP